jgi:3-phenylpropionate/cinnamic acid dioxygenase small subunit
MRPPTWRTSVCVRTRLFPSVIEWPTIVRFGWTFSAVDKAPYIFTRGYAIKALFVQPHPHQEDSLRRSGVYWVPSTPHGGDPRRQIAVMVDDRRRLEDRVYRLRTGFAWSQASSRGPSGSSPNVEVFATKRTDARMLRSNFLIGEFWDRETRTLIGWAGYRVVRSGCGWKIAAKQVNLLECGQAIRNLSIIL